MSLAIRRSADFDRWDDLVAASPHGTPFHLSGFLRVLRDRTGSTLHPLVGYDGEEPVGLLPFFEVEKGPLSALLSPAPRMKVSYQGPVLATPSGLEPWRLEERNQRFVDAALRFVREELSPDLINVRTGSRYDDVRPFRWNGFRASAGHTYVTDLSRGREELLAAFGTDARRPVKRGPPDDCEIRVGGPPEIELIVERVIERYEEQDLHYPITPAYVVDLWRALPAGTLRPYVCERDGTFIGGAVTLELGDTVYGWQAGAERDTDVAVNELLTWRVMCDAIDRGLTRYDLVGANEPGISEFKAKFDPHLERYHDLRLASPLARLAMGAYERLR